MPDLKDTSVCGESRTDGSFCPTSEHPGEVHTLDDGTVFRTVPPIPEDMLVAERLRGALARIEQLEAELEPARYWVGPTGCAWADPEDRACEEYADADGYDRADVEYCSHVEHRIATWADRHARECLDDIVQNVCRVLLAAPEPHTAWAKELVEDNIDGPLGEMRETVQEIGGNKALLVSDARAVLAEIEETLRQWREDPVQEQIAAALDRMFVAEEKAKLLRVEVRELKADREWLLAQGGDRLRAALINAKRAKAAATPGGAEGSAVAPSVASEGPGVAAQHPEGGDRG